MAASTVSPTLSVSQPCYTCGKTDKDLIDRKVRNCTECRIAHYCSHECQDADWKDHKVFCRKNIAALHKKLFDRLRNKGTDEESQKAILAAWVGDEIAEKILRRIPFEFTHQNVDQRPAKSLRCYVQDKSAIFSKMQARMCYARLDIGLDHSGEQWYFLAPTDTKAALSLPDDAPEVLSLWMMRFSERIKALKERHPQHLIIAVFQSVCPEPEDKNSWVGSKIAKYITAFQMEDDEHSWQTSMSSVSFYGIEAPAITQSGSPKLTVLSDVYVLSVQPDDSASSR